jgi:hypothetical protein
MRKTFSDPKKSVFIRCQKQAIKTKEQGMFIENNFKTGISSINIHVQHLPRRILRAAYFY